MTPLRQRMTEGMQVRNLSPRTQDIYFPDIVGIGAAALVWAGEKPGDALLPNTAQRYCLLLISTETLFEPKLATARSCAPSPLKSPTATE